MSTFWKGLIEYDCFLLKVVLCDFGIRGIVVLFFDDLLCGFQTRHEHFNDTC